MYLRLLAAAGLAVGLAPIASAQELPEAVTLKREMIVTANPLATEAGAKVLRRGGTAVDAMIAAQTVLGLVEPQSSGIGGGAFVVYYDAKTRKVTTFDAREKAPMTTDEFRFAQIGDGGDVVFDPETGLPLTLSFTTAAESGLSVGAPGVPALMEKMHRRHGKLPWWGLFREARRLSLKGYPLTQRSFDQLAGNFANIEGGDCLDPAARPLQLRDQTFFEYFSDGADQDCAPKPVGTIITNPEYAKALTIIAWKGARGFYKGPIARALTQAVQTDPNIPGDLSLADLADYRVIERSPICVRFRGNKVCGMGPPSSGGLAVGQILGILDNFEASAEGPLGPESVNRYAMASRLAFADRNEYVGDADFVDVPIAEMIDPNYLASRADLIRNGADNPNGNGLEFDFGTATPGLGPFMAPDNTAVATGTTQISIVDRYGNALSMTSSIEGSFGNGVMVPGFGFILNNQLTDFSFQPGAANSVAAEKRPRSSMSPTLVLDGEGRVVLVTGSPGGSFIISYTAQSVVNVIDFGLDPQEAIAVPHIQHINTFNATLIEPPVEGINFDADGGFDQADVDALTAALVNERAHAVVPFGQTSGLGIIQVLREDKRGGYGWWRKRKNRTTLVGGADNRRDGAVGGR